MNSSEMNQINETTLTLAGHSPEQQEWILRNLNGFPIDRLPEIKADYRNSISRLKDRLLNSTYDKDGNLISRTIDGVEIYNSTISEDGLTKETRNGTHYYILKYDREGNVIECIDKSEYTEDEINMQESDDLSYTKEYDEENRLTNYKSDNFEKKISYKNTRSKSIVETTFFYNGKITSYTKATNDKILRTKETINFNKDYKMSSQSTYYYDENQNNIKIIQITANPEKDKSLNFEQHKIFDDKNRLIEDRYVKDNNTYTKYTYDDNDRVIIKECSSFEVDIPMFIYTSFDERDNCISVIHENKPEKATRRMSNGGKNIKFNYIYSKNGGFSLSIDGKEKMSVPDYL